MSLDLAPSGMGTGKMEVVLDMFDFGKHKGKYLSQVYGYWEWINNFSVSHPWSVDALTRRHSTKRNVHVHDLLSDLKSCVKDSDLQKGRRIHINAVESGIDSNMFVAVALINMYGKCGCMVEARTVFDGIQELTVVSWNALILGYADNRQGVVSLDLFSRMKDECRCVPNSVTYIAVLKACSSLAADGDQTEKKRSLKRGKEIHSEIGSLMSHFLQNTLIDMYANCGSVVDARTVFEGIQEPDVVSWNALILGYAGNGQGRVALDLFSKMKDESRCAPNSVTYVAVLKACGTRKKDLQKVRRVHANAVETGNDSNMYVGAALINIYAKCGSMVDARTVFDGMQELNVVSWNALILGYADNGQGVIALDMFSRMKGDSRCAPNSVTYIAVFKACTSLAADRDETGKKLCLEWGREIHSQIGCHTNHFVLNTLIDMYSKCGSMLHARKVFDGFQEPDVVSWNALILGYADNGQGLIALELFSRMKAPNFVTYIAVFKACGSIGALAIGRRFHSKMRDFDARLVTCLVDFYAKCGSMEEAREVFDLYPRGRVIQTWNSLLAGYSSFGDTGSVFNLFEAMQDQGFRADSVTFVCMLSCCSHAGLIEKARDYLEVMPKRYGITPTVKHYTCMIDLLGRANKLDEAVVVLQEMPCEPNVVTLMTLLGACRKWMNFDIGRLAFKCLVDLGEKNGCAHILMGEIYGSRGMWEDQERVLERGMSLFLLKDMKEHEHEYEYVSR